MLAAWLARRRIEKGEAPSSRARRVAKTAFTFTAVVAPMYGAYAILRPSGVWQTLVNFVPMLLVLMFASLLLFGTVEVVLGLLRPQRDRKWLIVALIALALVGLFGLAGPAWLVDGKISFRPGLLLLVQAAAAAALTWWSHLPPPPRSPGLFL